MQYVPDHIKKNLLVLFVGFNPSIRSAETGHHYANPNNRFWTILYEAGFTIRKYHPHEDETLLNEGYGFTNIVAHPTKSAVEITREEYNRGREILRKKIQRYRPKTVCFVGKGVYQQFSGIRNIEWGFQKHPVIKGVVEFVAPSTSGLVRMKLPEIIDIYRELQQYVQKIIDE